MAEVLATEFRSAAVALLQRAEIPLGAQESIDGVCRGEVLVIQRRGGYRFAIDAMLLAGFAGAPRGPVVDLGTGCGIIALLLAARGARSIVGVELQPALFQLAFRNVSLNRRSDQIRLLNADLRGLRGLLPAHAFDLVVSNPPYVALRAGRINPTSERAIARHEVACSPPDLASAARQLLRSGGTLKVIFPAPRLLELVGALTAEGLEPRRLRMVHPVPGRPARMVLLEAVLGHKAALEVLPPLQLFDGSGGYTAEVLELLGDARPQVDRELHG